MVSSPRFTNQSRDKDPRRKTAAMPSMAHEILVDLFKNRPSLAAEILAEVLGVPIPPYAQARLAASVSAVLDEPN
jgi:hypothetical protein